MSIVERALSRAKAQSGASATPSLSGRAADTDAIPRLEDPALVPTLTVDPASEQLVLDVVPINRDALRQAGLLPVETAERQIASQYRHIKDRALRPERDEADVTPAPVRILVVSSALSGDGKTFTALNLALRIAREGSNGVLLVDADIAKHHLTSVLRKTRQPRAEALVNSILRAALALPAGRVD